MDGEELPPGWAWATLADVCAVNPGTTTDHLSADDEVAFVPMAAVSELSNQIDTSRRRKLSEVAKGFTRFAPDDVLFAKITPCMENGKIAVVPEVPGNVAYGSTEFHVLRPHLGISSSYLHHFVAQQRFRDTARHHMSGAVGQQRVPAGFLSAAVLPVAPSAEQTRIATAVNALFEELDEAEAALARAREGVEQFRASLLHAACTGQLTAAWRRNNPPDETGADLLRRILAERRTAWERAERARLEARGTMPRGDAWKARYVEPVAPDLTDMPDLPEGWALATVETVGTVQLGRQRAPQYHAGEQMRPYLRVANVYEDRIDTSDIMTMVFDDDDFESYKLGYGDILLNEGQSAELVGRPAMFRDEVADCCFTNTLVRFRPDTALLADFALIMFRGWLRTGKFQKIAKITTNIAHLGAGRFAQLSMPIPPLEEQCEVVRICTITLLEIEGLGTDLHFQQKQCKALRQSILHAAFTGRLVPQDPADEPAAISLARLREPAASARRTRGRPVAKVPA